MLRKTAQIAGQPTHKYLLRDLSQPIQSLVHDVVKEPASLAVEPVGIQINGPHFSRIKPGKYEKREGQGAEHQQLQLTHHVGGCEWHIINWLRGAIIKQTWKNDNKNRQKSSVPHGKEHVRGKFFCPDTGVVGKKCKIFFHLGLFPPPGYSVLENHLSSRNSRITRRHPGGPLLLERLTDQLLEKILPITQLRQFSEEG